MNVKSGFKSILLSVAVAAMLIAPAETWAQRGKKPGGGGSGTPPGTIYFRHEGTMWQMDGAGTPASRVELATAPGYGDPSYARHEDQRWFVYDDVFFSSTFPNGRYVTDIRAGSEGGQDLLLLSESDVEVISSPIWAVDDASITFIGERWELDGDGVPTTAVDAGLYVLYVDFSSGTPVAGPLDFVADLSGTMHTGPDGFPSGVDDQITGHSWNYDGTKIAFGLRLMAFGSAEIWLADIPSGASSLLASDGGAPQWSPDGSRIGYVSSNGTVVHELATGRKKTLKRTGSTSWGRTIWSPTGDYFVTYHFVRFLSTYDAIYRFTADIGGKTELTGGLDNPVPRFNVLIPVGWRD